MSLFGKIVGGVVGFAVGGPVGAAAGAAIGGSKAAGKAVDAAGQAVKYSEEFVEGVGKVIVSAGVVVIDAVSDVTQAALNVAEGVIAFRPLRPSELVLARAVFGNSIPLDRVVLSTLIGAGDRPFTLPGSMVLSAAWAIPGIGPLLDIGYLLQGISNKYVIFIGRDGYNHTLHMKRDHDRKGQTFIHELTHVWQGHHQTFAWGYVLNSLWNQCKCAPNFSRAYDATPGQQWRTYQAEQQARLIEEWYVRLYRKPIPPRGSDPVANQIHVEDVQLTAYMTSNILPGTPDADTRFPIEFVPGPVTTAWGGKMPSKGSKQIGVSTTPFTPLKLR